jgi:hypothetical protein
MAPEKPIEAKDLKQEEPLGQIDNIQGIPKVALGDPYLEPVTNDLLLR